MSAENSGLSRAQRRNAGLYASGLVREKCLPAGCVFARPATDNKGEHCAVQPPMQVVRSIGGSGCDRYLSEEGKQYILKPDGTKFYRNPELYP